MKNVTRKICLGLLMVIWGFGSVDTADAQNQKIIIVVGAAGQEEFGKQFASWADQLESAIGSSDQSSKTIEMIRIGTGNSENSEKSDFEQLETAIKSSSDFEGDFWIVLMGHGTDDRKASKFNLRGLDVSAKQLNEWLTPLKARLVIVNCASASGPFISKLKGKNRIVVTSTKSAAQHNFSRFGGFFSQAIADPAFDLDKDQQTSLLEAFIAASSQTQEFYIQETRLATELAMIDDNGDGRGTPADWFKGTRVVKRAKSGEPDGLSANQVILVRRGAEAKLSAEQRKIRDDLESRLEILRGRKESLGQEAYYSAMEPILVELAKIYDSVDE